MSVVTYFKPCEQVKDFFHPRNRRLTNVDQDLIIGDLNRVCFQGIFRMIVAGTVPEVETIPVAGARKSRAILDYTAVQRAPLVRALILAGKDFALNMYQQYILAGNLDDFFPEIGHFGDLGSKFHWNTPRSEHDNGLNTARMLAISGNDDLELLLMKARFCPDCYPLLESLFQFFQTFSLLIIQEIGNLRMDGKHCLGAPDIEHLPAQFAEYLMADRCL
jgi:hypothetical protein